MGNLDLGATREAEYERSAPNLPVLATKNAPLPEMYQAAQRALAECNRVDECKDWADKAQALASYARQADDDTLYKMARRIQGRAVRRAGELLKTFQADPQSNLRQNTNGPRGGGAPTSTQRAAAEAAGMSKDQEVTAVRVANVPEPDFEAAVESEEPPTVTKLADMGKQTAEPPPSAREGFYEATHTMGALRRFAEKCNANAPELVARGLLDHELEEARRLVHQVDAWLDRFIVNLRRSA